MRRLTGLAAAAAPALLSVVAACAIPARDNDHDPSRIPEAALFVTVGTSQSIVGTQSTVFTLDASGSSDPKGRTLHFSWDLDGDGEFEVDDTAIECANGKRACLATMLPVPEQFPTSGVGSAPRTIRVKVRAGNGTAVAEAVAFLTNAAPVLDLAEDLFVHERVQPVVTLDPCALATPCLSADPDGDPVNWHWSQVAGLGDPVVLTTALDGSGTATFVAPAEPQELVFELAADDTLATTRARIRVRVGTQIWIGTEDPVGLYRLHPDFVTRRATITSNGALEMTAAAADPDDGTLWFAEYDPATNHAFLRRAGPFLDVVASYDLGETYVRSIAAFGGSARVTLEDPIGSQTIVQRYDESGPVGVPAFVPGYGPNTFVYEGPVSMPGSCWVITSNNPRVVQLDGTVGPAIEEAAVVNLRMSARDAVDGSLWIFHETDTSIPPIKNIQPDGTVVVITPPISLGGASFSMTPHPDGGVWVNLGISLTRVTIDGALTDEPDVLLVNPPSTVQYSLGGFFAADPIRRELWVSEKASQRLSRYGFGADGFLHREEVLLLPTVLDGIDEGFLSRLQVDRRGGRVFAIGRAGAASDEFFLAAIPRHLKRLETVPVPGVSAFYVSGDPVRGGGWVSSYAGFANYHGDPTPAQRIATSGRTLTVVEPDGQTTPYLGAVEGLRDGGAWLGGYTVSPGTGHLVRVDEHGTIVDDLVLVDGSPQNGAFGASIFKMAIDDGETWMCGTTQRPFSIEGYGPVMRANLQTGTAALLDGNAYTFFGAGVASAGDGVCWILDAGNYSSATDDCFTGPPNGAILRVDAADNVSYVGTSGGLTFTCPRALTLDRRDGSVWVSDIVANRGHVYRVSDPDLSTIGSWDAPGIPNQMALQPLCADAADNGCADLWFSTTSSTSHSVYRARATDGAQLEIREVFDLPAGHPIAIDVSP